ncbi:hypothetical protein ES703_86377 [subsurface metagenome]
MKSRKEANKRYYDKRIKPFRALKPPVDVYSCVFCGMMSTLSRLKRSDFYSKIYIRAGRVYFRPEEQETARDLLYAKQREYFKFMCDKVLDFLKFAIKTGLISEEDIILRLDLQIIQETPTSEPLAFVSSVNSINKLPFVDSSISTLQFSNQFVDSSTKSLQSSNQLKPIKSLGGVSDG